MARAYALYDGFDIRIDTVSTTKRAAMVNALVVTFRVPVLGIHTDGDIENMFTVAIGTSQYKIAQVEVTYVE